VIMVVTMLQIWIMTVLNTMVMPQISAGMRQGIQTPIAVAVVLKGLSPSRLLTRDHMDLL
jgi:hypothetical protein